MSMVLCPECGSKISERARVCPHCGYSCEDPSLAISLQETYEAIPVFECSFLEAGRGNEVSGFLPIEENRTLFQLYGKWEGVQKSLPAIAAVIMEMAKGEKVLMAEIDPYIKKMIEKGIYRFSIDKNGRILPTIQGENGIVKQVRLRETSLPQNLGGSLVNLQMQASLAEILEEIHCLKDAIRGIHIELQDDRISMAESAKDKFSSALRIQDARLREVALLNVTQAATDAKRALMRSFSKTLEYVLANSHKDKFQLLLEWKDGREISDKATEAFESLIAITNAVLVECRGYALLGEFEPVKESLKQFRNFIQTNGLDNRDTLLKLNESTSEHCMPMVEDFSRVTGRIAEFVNGGQIGMGEFPKIEKEK